MLSRTGRLRLTFVWLVIGGIVTSMPRGTSAADDPTVPNPVIRYEFRGNGDDRSEDGSNVNKNLIIIKPKFDQTEGVHLSVDWAKLRGPLPELDFGKGEGDFTIYVALKLDKDAPDGSWTIMETREANGPGGFSLKLDLNGKDVHWRFGLDNNEGQARYEENASALRERMQQLWFVRKNGKVSIFADGEQKKGPTGQNETEMGNALRKNGTLTFGSFPGTLFAAAIWRTALTPQQVVNQHGKPWPY